MCKSDNANSSAKGMPNAPCDPSASSCKAKVSRCMVQFRPKDDWKGEYGFDWMRIGGAGELSGEQDYKSIITGGYKPGAAVSYTAAEAYTALKGEYASGDVSTDILSPPENLKEYFVTYLNLFPKNTAGTPTPPFEAELKILITVEENAPDKIELECTDTTSLSLSKTTLTDKAVTTKKVSSETLKITCNAGFFLEQRIKVWSTFEGNKVLAGLLKIGGNDASVVKEAKFILVKVKTKINATENTGSFTAVDKQYLTNALHQALIKSTLEDCPNDLDLTKDGKFKIKGHGAGKTYGHFIYKKTAVTDTNTDGGLWEDAPNEEMFKYIQQAFFKKPANAKYKTGYFTVFSINEPTYDPGTMGQVEKVGVHNLVLFPGRKDTTCAHEALHGLGLQHSHLDNTPPEPDRKYTFVNGKTDNIISYATDRRVTWHWQWAIMRSNV